MRSVKYIYYIQSVTFKAQHKQQQHVQETPFDTSLSGYALLNASRIAANDLGAK
jgi:hypothetical protein